MIKYSYYNQSIFTKEWSFSLISSRFPKLLYRSTEFMIFSRPHVDLMKSATFQGECYDRSLMPQHFQVHLEDRLQTWTSLTVRFSLLGNNFRPFHLHPALKHVQQRRLNNNEEQRLHGSLPMFTRG